DRAGPSTRSHGRRVRPGVRAGRAHHAPAARGTRPVPGGRLGDGEGAYRAAGPDHRPVHHAGGPAPGLGCGGRLRRGLHRLGLRGQCLLALGRTDRRSAAARARAGLAPVAFARPAGEPARAALRRQPPALGQVRGGAHPRGHRLDPRSGARVTRVVVVAHHARRQQAEALAESLEAQLLMDEEGRGAWWNHRRALRWAADQDERVVIMEDDALPVPFFRERAAAVLARWPEELVSFYLGTGRPPQYQARIQRLLADCDDHIVLDTLI